MSREQLQQKIEFWRNERQRQLSEMVSQAQCDNLRSIADKATRESRMLKELV